MKLAANLAELLRKTSAMSFKVSEYHDALSTDVINALATNHILTALSDLHFITLFSLLLFSH